MPSGTDLTQHDALSEPVDLSLELKREILAREALLDRDHWTVLGIKPGATAEAVKLAYFEASRVFHPDRYYGKNLGSFRSRLDRIFQRLSEAHEALIEGLRGAGPRPADRGVTGSPRRAGSPAPVDARAEERRARLARHPYLATKARATHLFDQARAKLTSAPEEALRLLEKAKALGGPAADRAPSLEGEAKQQLAARRAEDEMRAGASAAESGSAAAAAQAYARAASLDPGRADAAYEAARWLMKAGRPIAEARALAQRAVTLRADHIPSQLLLAEICLKMGMGSVARRHADAALKRDPRSAEAKALLRQVR